MQPDAYLKKLANYGLFLFIFILFNNRKIVYFNGIPSRIIKVEGEHADHLTTATT